MCQVQKEESLLDEVKRHLAITWDDDDTNKTIQDYIKDAKTFLNENAGEEIDYIQDNDARRLLKEYCRYARNYSIESFTNNFLSDIVRLQIKYATSESSESSDL